MSQSAGAPDALARLAAVLESLPEAVFATDDRGRIVAASPPFAELSGFTPAELLGRGAGDLLPGAALEPGPAGGPALEATLVRADRSRLPVELRTSPWRDAGGDGLRIHALRDLSALRGAERSLASSERRFRALLQRNPAGIFRSTPDGRLLECNEAFARICGYGSAAELRERPLDELYFDREERERFVAELRRAGSLDHYAERLRRRDGSEFWVLTAATLLAEPEQGEVLQGAMVDITGLRAAESAVRSSERRYRELFHHNAAGVFRAAVDGTFLVCNDELARIFGFASGAELAGRGWGELYADPADGPRLVAELRRGGRLRNVEIRGRRRDGREVWTLAAAVLGREGGLEVVEGTLLDVTEQRRAEAALVRAEAQFRSLFDSMRAVVWRAEPESLRFLDVGARAEELLGFPAPRWTEQSDFWSDRLHPDDREPTLAARRRELAARRDHALEYRMIRADGATAWIYDAAHVVVEDGRATGLVGAFIDQTARKTLEEQLRQAQKMEAVGRLAGGIAHDFNNLMGVILGYAELLLEEPRPETERARIEEIRQASERATGLTRQLLAYSRRQVLQARTVHLNRLVFDFESMLQRVLGEDVRLETGYGHGLWPVSADPVQLEQILLNLAVNSRDAMPEGGVLQLDTANVELDAAFVARNRGSQEGSYVRLRVTDNGVGMDAETLAHVFEPFFTTKEPGRGTGLGLATVYGIVKQSDGYITVESRPGEGTSVAIYLPRLVGEEGAGAETGAGAAGGRPGGHETILLVEDARPFRRLVLEILTQAGYRVLEAASPGAALTIAAGHEGGIDLLLTDVVMPEMRGHDLAGVLRASRPDLRVVYMSGFSEEVVGAAARGKLRFLQKPFASDVLLRTLRDALAAPP